MSVTAMEDNKDQAQLVRLEDEEESESMTELFPSLDEVEQIIGYDFKDKSLLRRAFTHSSYRDESYERLEYLGDSVLNLLIASRDYFGNPDLPPGRLTRLRAANVDTEKLARVAVKHDLYKYLRHKKPLLDGQIREFMDAIPEYPFHSNGLIDAPKDLADMVESTIGAIFIDSNSSLDTTWKLGCCKPSNDYNFTYISPTNWTTSTISSYTNSDCKLWNNDPSILCFNYQSCKAGLLDSIKHDWKKVAVINIIFN